jgi:hypothetical protein
LATKLIHFLNYSQLKPIDFKIYLINRVIFIENPLNLLPELKYYLNLVFKYMLNLEPRCFYLFLQSFNAVKHVILQDLEVFIDYLAKKQLFKLLFQVFFTQIFIFFNNSIQE